MEANDCSLCGGFACTDARTDGQVGKSARPSINGGPTPTNVQNAIPRKPLQNATETNQNNAGQERALNARVRKTTMLRYIKSWLSISGLKKGLGHDETDTQQKADRKREFLRGDGKALGITEFLRAKNRETPKTKV